jgi:glycosyltransferase involved in cell wall biosynthesis
LTQARQPVRVCLMTTSHPVRYSRFFDREAVSLARAGFDVRLIGVGSTAESVTERGVRLVSVPRQGKLGLIAEVARVAGRESCDVYQCLDPWTLRSGLGLKRGRPEVKLVYESSEWFPRMWLDRADKPMPVRWLGWLAVTQLERAACRHADAVIETNLTRAGRFVRRGVEPVLVPNFPPLDMLPAPAVERNPWLAWTGLVSRPRGFDKLLQALVPAARRFPELRLRVIGEFDPRSDIEHWARSFIADQGIAPNVEFLGSLPYGRMFDELRRCMAGVILFQPGRGNDYTGQPNKLFEFMGSGLAVVASGFPEIAPVVLDADCGWLVDPQNPEAIASALMGALSDPNQCRARGEAGRRAVLARYHWGTAEQVLLGLYRRLTP